MTIFNFRKIIKAKVFEPLLLLLIYMFLNTIYYLAFETNTLPPVTIIIFSASMEKSSASTVKGLSKRF